MDTLEECTRKSDGSHPEAWGLDLVSLRGRPETRRTDISSTASLEAYQVETPTGRERVFVSLGGQGQWRFHFRLKGVGP